jgi:hypothetical protein
VPLREAAVDHPKARVSWPLDRGHDLLTDDGPNGAFVFERPGDSAPSVPADLTPPFSSGGPPPRIPADAKVALTFTRAIDDPHMIGDKNPAQVKAELIGDPTTGQGALTVQYTLRSIELQKWAPLPAGGFGWTTVSHAGDAGSDDTVKLLGSWHPAEDPQAGASEQNKLLLNSTTPFDYTSQRSRQWQDWFTTNHPDFPCPPFDPNEKVVAVFEADVTTHFASPFHFDDPAFDVDWQYGGDITSNEVVVQGVLGPINRGLRLSTFADPDNQERLLFVTPPPGNPEVRLRVGTPFELIFTPFDRGRFFTSDVGVKSAPLLLLQQTVQLFTFNGIGDGRQQNQNIEIINDNGVLGADLANSADIVPQVPALAVALVIEKQSFVAFIEPGPGGGGTAAAPPANQLTVTALDADGNVIDSASIQEDGTHNVHVHGTTAPIARVLVNGSTDAGVRLVLTRLYVRTPVVAVAFSPGDPGTEIGRFEEQDGLITVKSDADIGEIFLSTVCGGEFTLLELSLPSRLDIIVQHTVDSLQQLTREDPLFEPRTDHRLVVTAGRTDTGVLSKDSATNGVLTHSNDFVFHAYFRVAGPPGTGTSDRPPQAQPGPTGLEDLRLYVDQTVPPTIPAEGEKLLIPRAVYRAYDVAVKFNENYAELMYVLTRRDLTVRLFDAGNQPVLAPDGSVLIPTPSWERSRQVEVKDAVALWVGIVNQAACRPGNVPLLDLGDVLRPQVLSAPDEEVVLAPQALHQVRLVPALLHETFVGPLPNLAADGVTREIERWRAENAGAAPSSWQVQSEALSGVTNPDGTQAFVFFVTEATGNEATLLYRGPLAAEDDTDAPSAWSDVRASVRLRWSVGVVGIDLRRASPASLLRFTLERPSGNWQLLDGTGTLDSGTSTLPDAGSDVDITIDFVGDHARVLQTVVDQTGATVTVELTSFTGVQATAGTVGLYQRGAAGARFTEVRVDDLRSNPSAAFAFDFITSRYANFFHHLHSYDGQRFEAPGTLDATDLSGSLGVAKGLPGPDDPPQPPVPMGAVPDDERRRFEDLAAKVLGTTTPPDPERVEVVRASQDDALVALLVRSPEPIAWERTVLRASVNPQPVGRDIPGDLKLAEVFFAAKAPAEESVTVLVRSGATASLSQVAVQWRPLPDPSVPAADWSTYFVFGNEPPLPDGTRVRIFADVPADAPPREPGTTQRFITTDPATAHVTFSVPGVELRLLAPDGSVLDQRRFLTRDGFDSFDVRVLRRPDGTAFLVFVPPQTPNPPIGKPATLRLDLTFIRALGDEDLRLRQAGSEQAEVVSLDLPIDVPPPTGP